MLLKKRSVFFLIDKVEVINIVRGTNATAAQFPWALTNKLSINIIIKTGKEKHKRNREFFERGKIFFIKKIKVKKRNGPIMNIWATIKLINPAIFILKECNDAFSYVWKIVVHSFNKFQYMLGEKTTIKTRTENK